MESPEIDRNEIRTVLFDLDGTLADTAPDLAFALNTLLTEQNRPTLHYDRIRPHVSHGATALVRIGFGMEPGSDEFVALRVRFLEIYREHVAAQTQLFPGMTDVLNTLERNGVRWGVVTNKPAHLTEPLMAALGLERRAACIVSGDSTTERKPHPSPMLYACSMADCQAYQCLYVGDAERDIEAGRRAGMKTMVALFGYIETGERPELWQADAMIRHPGEIIRWLNLE